MRIATRGSALALWQANWVRDRLMADDPELAVELLVLKTRGDKILDRALSEVGGKGLFVKEIEEALLDGRAEVAVHSMKDLPAEIPDGLVLGAVPVREDPRDALLVAPALAARDVAVAARSGARVGTSSLRRVCQLKARRPDLEIVPLRGNVDTRVRKVDAGELDAIVLACAGLKRLGHARAHHRGAVDGGVAAGDRAGRARHRVPRRRRRDAGAPRASSTIAPPRTPSPPSAAFCGACRATARRRWRRTPPSTARASIIEGLVGAPDGSKLLRHTLEGTTADAADVGHALAEELLAQGADELLAFTTSELVGGEYALLPVPAPPRDEGRHRREQRR